MKYRINLGGELKGEQFSEKLKGLEGKFNLDMEIEMEAKEFAENLSAVKDIWQDVKVFLQKEQDHSHQRSGESFSKLVDELNQANRERSSLQNRVIELERQLIEKSE